VDYGPSIVLWVMDDVAAIRCDQYLVFNNIKQVINGEGIKEGVMIKLSDGMMMSFQGSTLRHGTTIHQDSASGKLCPPGNIYGIHFGLSMPTLTCFQRVQIDQYIKEMSIIPKMIVCNRNDQSHEHNYDKSNKGKRVRKNQIQFPKQKMKRIDEVVKNMTNITALSDNNYDMTTTTEDAHHPEVTFESSKNIFVRVNKDKPEKMKQQFDVLKYEEIIPNWMAFFKKVNNHKCIRENC